MFTNDEIGLEYSVCDRLWFDRGLTKASNKHVEILRSHFSDDLPVFVLPRLRLHTSRLVTWSRYSLVSLASALHCQQQRPSVPRGGCRRTDSPMRLHNAKHAVRRFREQHVQHGSRDTAQGNTGLDLVLTRNISVECLNYISYHRPTKPIGYGCDVSDFVAQATGITLEKDCDYIITTVLISFIVINMYWNWNKSNIVILKIYTVDWTYYLFLNSFH
jgi:hypothetical protein